MIDNKSGGQTRGGLLIHPGGLGDVCLSESTFLSLEQHFGNTLTAIGSKSVLDVFRAYFGAIDSLDRRRWMHLFSGTCEGQTYERIVFVGKDKTGALRERFSRLCGSLIFIDMYPDERLVHVEDYQLGQLNSYGITPVKKKVDPRPGKRVILYPEKAYKKKKWPVGCFLEVYEKLTESGVEAVLMRPPELDLPAVPTRTFRSLAETAAFFSAGGLFFSNDSGMAHFAARCGLRVATLFQETNPVIWGPKGGVTLACLAEPPSVEEVIDFVVRAREG